MYGKGLHNFMADAEENLVTLTKTSRWNNSKLKESTGRLMCLLDEIDAKTRSKAWSDPKNNPSTVKLTDEYDDCSVYKKLTRTCQCLNRTEYTDILMEFNADTRYQVTHFGGILKNVRSLKKFLYIGNGYCKNALNFLTEGLTTSTSQQKEELIKACAYADICNIFEENSIVTKCIIEEYHMKLGQTIIPILALKFLKKLAETKEGKKYLTMSTKLIHEIMDFLKREENRLNPTLRDIIYDVLDLLKTGDCSTTVDTLARYHDNMSKEEVTVYLQKLEILSDTSPARTELIKRITLLLQVFKSLLIKFNDSELNIMVTNILNNIVTRNLIENQVDYVKYTPMWDLKRNFENRSTSPVNISEKKTKKCKVDFHVPKNIPSSR